MSLASLMGKGILRPLVGLNEGDTGRVRETRPILQRRPLSMQVPTRSTTGYQRMEWIRSPPPFHPDEDKRQAYEGESWEKLRTREAGNSCPSGSSYTNTTDKTPRRRRQYHRVAICGEDRWTYILTRCKAVVAAR